MMHSDRPFDRLIEAFQDAGFHLVVHNGEGIYIYHNADDSKEIVVQRFVSYPNRSNFRILKPLGLTDSLS
jgi:hypothetical protein